MGIKQLMSLLQEKAPGCIRKIQLEHLTGRTIACDASMAIYQFLIATQGINQGGSGGLTELTDKEGNRTAHLVGIMSRTVQFLEHGIKPIWVFDGKAPTLKSGEIAKRKKAKDEALKKFEEAQEAGELETALKQKILTTSVTSKMTEDCKKMLRLMGAPIIEAPEEAEAQCVALVKAGKAYATATEDMDALTFGTEILLRGFNNKKEPILEVSFQQMLKELDMPYEQFIDLCILLGCDYTESIEGIGPVTAFKLIKEHKTLENVVKKLEEENRVGTRKRKWQIPDPYRYPDARELFKNPVVISDLSTTELKFVKPDDQGLTEFLVQEKGFSDQRVANVLKKLKATDTKGTQSRLDSFFKVSSTKTSTTTQPVKKVIKDPKKDANMGAKKPKFDDVKK